MSGLSEAFPIRIVGPGRLKPTTEGLLRAAASARLAVGSGLHAEAQRDYEQLARRHPDDARWRQSAAAEHSAALKRRPTCRTWGRLGRHV